MTRKTFSKTLSANDVGATGGHQGGILIPKSEAELLSILPSLDPAIKNPDAWIECVDEGGTVRRFRFVYYNNKLHDIAGTRNEYRITYMTGYFKEMVAGKGESFEISRDGNDARYLIRIAREQKQLVESEEHQEVRIKIKSTWRRVH
ncbi:restriction endonuclease [Pseudomonas sp. MMS21-TM103]|uniref:EcoRII N-terminal effector-binding domain-containing protein n=1 Tax=Pseudomonas sp. MMS21 TM103 TaxID=2886506 RepID=UPI001EDF603A|nr:EcoRII N-terminal effector-binding domain-containing protein [Pseudomonas sp. MMS21 TM103]MCG4453333.1 restriction endonuclease [Pseudomonas sp. MMS21 TM103]